MKIDIEHREDQFNVHLLGNAGEPFLSIYGCRIRDGSKGRFVSWPAKKNEKTGKYWNHVKSSDAFTDAVIAAYDGAGRPPAPPPMRRPSVQPARRQDDDAPF